MNGKVPVQVWLDPELHEALTAAAKAADRSVASFVREAIRDAVDWQSVARGKEQSRG